MIAFFKRQTSRLATITVFFSGAFILLLPLFVSAQEFVELVGIPYLQTEAVSESEGLAAYANSLYLAAISIAAVLAVLRIVIAGVKYTVTDIVTTKGQAKKDIQNALLGLLIIVGAFLILYTINPNLTNMNALDLTGIKGELQEYGIGDGNPIAGSNETFTDTETVTWIGAGRSIGSIDECISKNGRVIEGRGNIGNRCILPKRDFEGCADDEKYVEGRLDNIKCVSAEDFINNLPTDIEEEAEEDGRTELDYEKFRENGINTDLISKGYLVLEQNAWESMSLIEKREYESRLCQNNPNKSLRTNGGIENNQVRFYCLE